MINLSLKDFILYRCMCCHCDMLNEGTNCECIVVKGIFCDRIIDELALADLYDKFTFAKKEINHLLNSQKNDVLKDE